jgi:hypothetical protein
MSDPKLPGRRLAQAEARAGQHEVISDNELDLHHDDAIRDDPANPAALPCTCAIHSTPYELSILRMVTPRTLQAVLIILLYTSRMHELAHPAKVLHTTCELLGVESPDVNFGRRHKPSLQRYMVKRDWLREADPDSLPCRCHCYPAEFLHDGHLLSTKHEWNNDPLATPALTEATRFGLSHIPLSYLCGNVVVDEYLRMCCYIPNARYEHAAHVIKHVTLDMLRSRTLSNAQYVDPRHSYIEIVRIAKYVAQHFFVRCIDKAKSQPFFMCKWFSMQLVLRHLKAYNAFIHAATYDYTLLTSAMQHLARFQIPLIKKLPTMYPIVKVHKQPMQFRFITATAGCYASEFAKVMHVMLWEVFAMLKIAAHVVAQHYHASYGYQIRLDTVLRDSMQATINLPRTLRDQKILTCDISKCYDVVPTAATHPHGVCSRIHVAIDIIRQFLHQKMCMWIRYAIRNTLKAKTSHETQPGFRHIGWKRLTSMLQTLPDANYVLVGRQYFQHVIGFPQGLAPGPVIINIILMTHDLMFVMYNHHDLAQRWYIQCIFTCYLRFIDDLCIIHEHMIEAILHMVYPEHFLFGVTSDANGVTGTFLNLEFLKRHGVLFWRTCFKADKLPFTPLHYIHLLANRSISFSNSVFKGHLLVAMLLNNTTDSFIRHIRILTSIFTKNGFAKHKLRYMFSEYFSDASPDTISWFPLRRAIKKAGKVFN